MIGFINGRVDHIGTGFCLVEAQGVGYRIFMNASDLGRLAVDQRIKIYTYLSVREDALQLYGFLSYDMYSLFTKLITVSGIGPKVALGVLSATKTDAFFLAIRNRDIKYLTKLPGIGKKTAERMLLELKNLVGPETGSAGESGSDIVQPVDNSPLGEAMDALASLGYTQDEISYAMNRLQLSGGETAEAIIRKALQLMVRRN